MSDIRFYHLAHQTLAQALPRLLEKALQSGHRMLVKAPSTEAVERLNTALWTDRPESFLPHGSAKDGHATEHPVWLTASDENPNGASVLVLVEGAHSEHLGDYTLICDMLDGTQAQAVALGRTRWKHYKEAGHTVTYWQQSPQGWEKKA